jgi:hypothetical protein
LGKILGKVEEKLRNIWGKRVEEKLRKNEKYLGKVEKYLRYS